MGNEIREFMKMAVLAQMATAGDDCTVTGKAGRSYKVGCRAVLTSRDGSMDANVGGTLIAVTGHALIQISSIPLVPKPGDVISVNGEEGEWVLTNVIVSPNDQAYSCDLVRSK